MTASEKESVVQPAKRRGKRATEQLDPEPLFKFAFGCNQRLTDAQRLELQHELHAIFRNAGNPPWGYGSSDELATLVKKWLAEIKTATGKDLSVNLSESASTKGGWYIGGERHTCVQAPVFIKEGGKKRRWKIKLSKGKTSVPISFRSSRVEDVWPAKLESAEGKQTKKKAKRKVRT